MKTGIIGLDEVLAGGFRAPSTILIVGTAGTGKTTFIMQSLFNSAANGERVCLFIPILSEAPAMINNYMSQFEFYDPGLYEKKNVFLFSMSEKIIGDPKQTVEFISGTLEQVKPQRIAIDPINALTYCLNPLEERKFWYDLFTRMKGWGTLVLASGEYTEQQLVENAISYLADGIIYLSTIAKEGTTRRFLHVRKMRGIPHDINPRFIEIQKKGIEVLGKVYQ